MESLLFFIKLNTEGSEGNRPLKIIKSFVAFGSCKRIFLDKNDKRCNMILKPIILVGGEGKLLP